MSYRVKEIFFTLQGEGAHSGRPAVFCRFAGCNLWSGRERHRASAICQFCDTDFVGIDGTDGGSFATADELAGAVARLWQDDTHRCTRPYVVCTGGEPLLQLDTAAITALHAAGLEIGVETNGTLPVPTGIDWLCVSPKAGTELIALSGDELKLVFPQTGAEPELFDGLDFDRFSLQPMDGNEAQSNLGAAISYCLEHPHWRLSLQTHKYIGIR